MFLNTKTNTPAWLISHDGDGVTFTDGARKHHAASFEFFSVHREASADEIAAQGAPPRKAAKARAAPKAKAARSPRKAKAAPASPAAPAEAAPPAEAAKPADAPPAPTLRVEPLG